jgi:hypothetical protein
MRNSTLLVHSEKQIREAATFERENGSKIELARLAILAACGRILESDLVSVLEDPERDAIKRALAANALVQPFSCLRPQAARFVVANCSTVYWQWIDAANFFDAVGSSWPYMTMERRTFNITEAKADADRIFALDGAPLRPRQSVPNLSLWREVFFALHLIMTSSHLVLERVLISGAPKRSISEESGHV